MRNIRVSGLTALASALALAVTAIPFSGFASGPVVDAPTAATAVQAAAIEDDPAETLTLSTTSSRGTVSWNGETQEFAGGQQCQIMPVGEPADLLVISGSVGGEPGTAGFRNGNVGVFEFDAEGDGPNNASQCARVDAGSFTATETLGLELGEDVADDFGTLTATGATVSLVAQSRDGKISVTLVGAGETADVVLPVEWKRTKSGDPINIDAFKGDFIGIRLKAVQGSFSLRGAEFTLRPAYDGVLGCSPETNFDSIAPDGADPGVEITRLRNADPLEECDLIPYTLRNGGQTVRFLKPLDEQLSAQFVLDFVWTVSPPNTVWEVAPATNPLLPETSIDYEQEGDLGEIDLRWCPDVTLVNGYPEVANVLSNGAAADQVPDAVLPGKQFTCIVSQNSAVADGTPDDYVTIEQRVYLLGDAAYRFR